MNLKNYKIHIINQSDNPSLYVSHLKNDPKSKIAICYENNIYKIFKKNNNKIQKIWIDFNSSILNYRRKKINNKENIAKAIGIKKNYFPYVLDVTAGLGTDAFILASLGCQVLMLERNPVITLLLSNALNRALKNKNTNVWLKKRLSLIYSSSESFLKKTKIQPEVIYLDPMFPVIKKRAASKKNIQMLKIVVKEKDNTNLLELSRLLATKRVVVKRTKKCPFLNNTKTYTSIESKNHRFDIYQPLKNS